MKRKWKRPELVVLVKGRPEENVLFHCKAGINRDGPTGDASYCKVKVSDVCTNCQGSEQT
jgi:hypothetical protein